uniref:Uncharacterized protein n=1 Tax=Bactrocera latifrons TaxID=174628 RepID=A0A0K8VBP9_BACLA
MTLIMFLCLYKISFIFLISTELFVSFNSAVIVDLLSLHIMCFSLDCAINSTASYIAVASAVSIEQYGGKTLHYNIKQKGVFALEELWYEHHCILPCSEMDAG